MIIARPAVAPDDGDKSPQGMDAARRRVRLKKEQLMKNLKLNMLKGNGVRVSLSLGGSQTVCL